MQIAPAELADHPRHRSPKGAGATMLATSPPPEPAQDALVVEREDIEFWISAPGRLRIRITVHNTGDVDSEPTVARIESAAFGAFLPWSPLSTMRVPRIAARGKVTIETEVPDPFEVQTISGRGHVPAQPLIATGSGERERDEAGRIEKRLERLWAQLQFLESMGDGSRRTRWMRRKLLRLVWEVARSGRRSDRALSPELEKLIQEARKPVHMAGNLNVFVGGRSTERHMSVALKIVPAITNVAVFMVGAFDDEICFRFTGSGVDWNPELAGISIEGGEVPIRPATWYWPGGLTNKPARPVIATGWFYLRFLPPAGTTSGALNVHVERRSTGEEAVVEFGFGEDASAPGCYQIG